MNIQNFINGCLAVCITLLIFNTFENKDKITELENALDNLNKLQIKSAYMKYIDDFIYVKDNMNEFIRIFLKYDYKGQPVISEINRVSKPGYRVYVECSKIPKVLDGLGISILSTSKGVISNRVAKKLGVGGEILCNVW